jgi:MOSC domain-containing protein YiiM
MGDMYADMPLVQPDDMKADFAGPTRAGSVMSIHVGRARPLGSSGVVSGFVKTAVTGRVHVASLGLDGDEQADLRVHGGMDKAVYGYGVQNYVEWRADFPEHSALFAPGGVGENLAIHGLDERTVCLGDLHLIGTVLLAVSQHRQPCYKFALRFNDPRVVRAMVENGRCGWYYRVVREGYMQAGDEVRVVERPNPLWSVARFADLDARHAFHARDWAELATLSGLAEKWRAKALVHLRREI